MRAASSLLRATMTRDQCLDLRMQRYRDRMLPDRLDRGVEHDLAAVHGESRRGDESNKVARRNRSEELARFRGLSQHREFLSVELVGDNSGLTLERERTRLELALHRFKSRAVLRRGAQGLASPQQEIAGEAVLDAHHLAHLPQPGHAFEQDHFHLDLSFGTFAPSPRRHQVRLADHVGQQPQETRALDRLRELALLLC